MTVTAIIPARYASTRLAGKMLLDRTGMPLICHVVKAVDRAKLIERTVVATDDERIFNAVVDRGAEAIMTSADCRTGTDRIAQAAEKLNLNESDVVINVQGDEPEIPAAAIDKLVGLMLKTDAPMATLACEISAEQAKNINKTKVVLAKSGAAMYFSRLPVPFDRDGAEKVQYLLHIGIYAYNVDFLKIFTSLPSTSAEESEKLEQLRALEHGYEITVAMTDYHGCGIDTPEDYDAFVKRYNQEKNE